MFLKPLFFPSRTITMIVPFAAGGPGDTRARVLAEHMRGTLGQPVVVENVTGAGGSIGVGRVAQAPGDGYTLRVPMQFRDSNRGISDAPRLRFADGSTGVMRCRSDDI